MIRVAVLVAYFCERRVAQEAQSLRSVVDVCDPKQKLQRLQIILRHILAKTAIVDPFWFYSIDKLIGSRALQT